MEIEKMLVYGLAGAIATFQAARAGYTMVGMGCSFNGKG